MSAALCDTLAKRMGYTVINLEQRRASRTHIGLPDRRLVGERCAFFFELKFGRDRLSREQYTFLDRELNAGEIASCGGIEELSDLLSALGSSTQVKARNICRMQLDRWKAKGFRGERAKGVAA